MPSNTLLGPLPPSGKLENYPFGLLKLEEIVDKYTSSVDINLNRITIASILPIIYQVTETQYEKILIATSKAIKTNEFKTTELMHGFIWLLLYMPKEYQTNLLQQFRFLKTMFEKFCEPISENKDLKISTEILETLSVISELIIVSNIEIESKETKEMIENIIKKLSLPK